MNDRLKVLCILLAAIYIYLIGYAVGGTIYNMFGNPFGEQINKTENNKEASTPPQVEPTYKHHFRVIVNVDPKNVKDISSKSVVNKFTNEPIVMEIGKAKANFQIYESSFPTWIWIAVVIQVLVMIGIFFTVGYIPVLTFKIIKSVIRDLIFDTKNIKRIRNIGYATLFIFLGFNYYLGVDQLIAEKYISISEYNIVSPDRKSIFLLFGIVILIFAEVLKISQKMKEEQDLTV